VSDRALVYAPFPDTEYAKAAARGAAERGQA